MIIFALSKCKRYENRKIQGVALPKKERNGQEWSVSFMPPETTAHLAGYF